MQFRPDRNHPSRSMWFLLLLITLVTLLPLWFTVRTLWGMSNMAYEVTPTHLLITFGPTVEQIERADIVQATVLEAPSRGRRIVGTNMSGLYEGTWSFAETGRITLYATSLRPLTVIETPGRKWGISPADPEAFLTALQTGSPARFEPPTAGTPWGVIALLALPVLLSGVLIYMFVYLTRLSRDLRYELSASELVIYGGRKPVRIPYADIESVEVKSPAGLPLRVFGVGLPGLYWGSYSWRSAGPNLYMYATRLRPLVLVTTRRRTHGLTPKETDLFIDELTRRVEQARKA